MHKLNVDLNQVQKKQEDTRACRSEAVKRLSGEEGLAYISQYVDMADIGTEVMATSEAFNIEVLNGKILHSFVNLKRINDLEDPNQLFSYVNNKLTQDGYFVCCVETLKSRRRRILNKYSGVIAYPVYMLDFILKRIFPKLRPTRKIYSILTRGQNRVVSITEALGRLVACGFAVVDYKEIGHLTYLVCRKVKAPVYKAPERCGIIITLDRVGYRGEIIKIFKLRTMHPFSEYLQGHVSDNNCLCAGGKFKEDFRVTSWGRVMRKLWLDEQPMWFNWLKREVKLVGVRPLSEQYFSLYPEDFRKRRINYKPGLIPPFYKDLPSTLEEIIASEQKYLDAYDRHPYLTDLRYLFAAIYNIFLKGARSA